MKFKKKLLCLLSVSIISFCGINTNINAESINKINTNITNSDLMKGESVSQNHFENLMKSIHKERKSKAINTTDKYVNFQNVSNNPNNPIYNRVVYSKQQFLDRVINKNTRVYNSSKSGNNSWMRLTLEIDDIGSGKRGIYGFYQWLTNPLILFNDSVAIGCDANTVLLFSSSTSANYIDYKDNEGRINTSSYTYKYSNMDHRTTSANGILYTFPLQGDMIAGCDYAYPNDYQYGVISVDAQRGASSSGNIVFSYAHEQVNLTTGVGISFTGEGSLSFGLATSYDHADIGDVVNF
ncbi:hypothetical protein [Clostridium felsineum]|uniref:hypothetical protein n=1 Tax=Clostridium felsineum TaxID=36839 RepID=UPI00098C01F6|nr:hypothetical protein [Clostridium felsineum]URZ02376.1 hypothetical protein CLAUR_023730 [Clostridium felsineum]